MIHEFKEDYAFLSNFYMKAVIFEGMIYPSSEHAYQAAKTLNILERQRISELVSPSFAKKAGKLLDLREDWEEVKEDIMYRICKEKFAAPNMKAQLLGTGDEELVEYNYWHDNTWGFCTCISCSNITHENKLGKILMKIREELKHK